MNAAAAASLLSQPPLFTGGSDSRINPYHTSSVVVASILTLTEEHQSDARMMMAEVRKKSKNVMAIDDSQLSRDDSSAIRQLSVD